MNPKTPPPTPVSDPVCPTSRQSIVTKVSDGHTRETAMVESHLKMPELREDDDPDWVTVTLPEALPVQDHSQKPYSDYTLPAVRMNSIEQSHGDHLLKIEVSTAPRIAEDMTPPCIDAESSSRVLLPPLGLHGDQYTLIRLFRVEDENVVKKLDANIGKVNEMPYIKELSDGSWEICILKSHHCTVKDTLCKIFPGSNVDLYYNPLEPTAKDSKIWGHNKAKTLYEELFFERAIRVIREAWPAGAACYAYRLKVMSGLGADFTLVPTYQGYLQSKEDAVYLLKACLSGKLIYSCRGPQDGEATISSNIFVWEANITGIDR